MWGWAWAAAIMWRVRSGSAAGVAEPTGEVLAVSAEEVAEATARVLAVSAAGVGCWFVGCVIVCKFTNIASCSAKNLDLITADK